MEQALAIRQAKADSPPETRGDRTRANIKAVIRRLATRKELADIALADICAAAKITTGALYFHFKGKEEAIEETIIDEIADIYGRRLAGAEGAPFATIVGRILERSSDYNRRCRKLARAVQVTVNTRPLAYQAWLAARAPLIVRIETAIVAARQGEGLDPDPAPYLAHFILNSIEDLALDVFYWSNPTLTPFAETVEAWNARQIALWNWAILAPIPAQVTSR